MRTPASRGRFLFRIFAIAPSCGVPEASTKSAPAKQAEKQPVKQQPSKPVNEDPIGRWEGEGGALADGPQMASDGKLRLSDKARELKRDGKHREAMDVHYEDQVRRATGGTSQEVSVGGVLREVDSVTDEALIQAKRTYSAADKPENFLNKATRKQIKATIEAAEAEGKTAEFWFKYGAPRFKRILNLKVGSLRKD